MASTWIAPCAPKCSVCSRECSKDVRFFSAPIAKYICHDCIYKQPVLHRVYTSSSISEVQHKVITDYIINGKHIEEGNPKHLSLEEWLCKPINFQALSGVSLGVTGAVGVGKSTLMRALFASWGFKKIPYEADYISLYSVTDCFNNKHLFAHIVDFSHYIEKRLGNIGPDAHFHASVFYSTVYKELWQLCSKNRPVLNGKEIKISLLWDRSMLENLAFARDVIAGNEAAVFHGFWPTKAAHSSFLRILPKTVFMVGWWKENNSPPENDNDWYKIADFDWPQRSELVRRRARCTFELDHADDQQDILLSDITNIYILLNIPVFVLNLHKPVEVAQILFHFFFSLPDDAR